MINRLRQIASHFNLSPAAFADQIGVSRPVISHIFSERNKPSLEVIQKIGVAFPDLDLAWLLYGEGEMLKSLAKATISNKVPEQSVTTEPSENAVSPEKEVNRNSATSMPVADSLVSSQATSNTVIKIVFFYADNTFQEFQPTRSS